MRYNILIVAACIGLVLGFALGWAIKPKTEIIDVHTEKYELEAQIRELEYQYKTDSIKHKHTTDFMHFENGDSTYRDSILISLGY